MTLKDNKNIISDNINRLLAQKNKTRQEACEEMGIGYSTFTEWANGRKYPRIDKIELMADYFGVSKSELIEANKVPTDHALDSTENRRIFANNLSYFMELRGKTRADVCTDLKIGYSALSSWLSATNYPRIEKIEQLAQYFNINKSNLIEPRQIGISQKNIPSADIGLLIKNKRIEKKLTQEELGALLGVGNTAVYKWEKGIVKNLKRNIMQKLANVLDLDPSVLTGFDAEHTAKIHSKENQRVAWLRAFGDVDFTDDELNEIISFSKYILSKRQSS